MISHWEEFSGGPRKPARERVHITLSQKGNILLNRNAYDMIGAPAAAVLLFDRFNSTIGVRPAKTGPANAFPVVEKCNNYFIRANPFCRHYGIKIEGTIVFNDAQRGPDGVLSLDLRTATSVAARAKATNRPAMATK